ACAPVNDLQYVGRVVYPLGVTNRPGDNTGIPEVQAHMLASGTFFWSPSADDVAFGDTHQHRVSVILVHLDSNGSPHPLVKELSRAEVCVSPDTPKCEFLICSIEFVPAGVRVNLKSYSTRIKSVVELPLSVF